MSQQSPDATLTCPGNTYQTAFDYLAREPGRVSPEEVIQPFVNEDAGEFMTVMNEDGSHPIVLVHREDGTVKAKVTLSLLRGADWQADVSACAGFDPSVREHH